MLAKSNHEVGNGNQKPKDTIEALRMEFNNDNLSSTRKCVIKAWLDFSSALPSSRIHSLFSTNKSEWLQVGDKLMAESHRGDDDFISCVVAIINSLPEHSKLKNELSTSISEAELTLHSEFKADILSPTKKRVFTAWHDPDIKSPLFLTNKLQSLKVGHQLITLSHKSDDDFISGVQDIINSLTGHSTLKVNLSTSLAKTKIELQRRDDRQTLVALLITLGCATSYMTYIAYKEGDIGVLHDFRSVFRFALQMNFFMLLCSTINSFNPQCSPTTKRLDDALEAYDSPVNEEEQKTASKKL